jgi:small subunit ribosomal protein S5
VLSKSLGSQNPINLVKATMTALEELRSPDQVAALRGLSISEVLGTSGGNGGEKPADEAAADAPAADAPTAEAPAPEAPAAEEAPA